MAYETLIGFRYLRSRKRSTFISVITLISVIGVRSHAIVSRVGIDFKDHAKVAKRISQIEGVKSVAPIVLGESMIAAGNRIAGAGVKGISLDKPVHLKALKKAHFKGDINRLANTPPGQLPGIALGKELADRLRVSIGDTVQLVSPVSLFGLQYRAQTTHKAYRVSYIFRLGMYQYDSKFCFLQLKEAQSFFRLKGSVSGIELYTNDIYKTSAIKRQIMIGLGGWPYQVQDWRDQNSNLFRALEQNKIALGIILLFIILVASLNIAGTLILMVLEKAKDIAILRAMGATRGGVMQIFMTYGLYIGALGTLVGLVLGYLLCTIANQIEIKLDSSVYFITKLPILINPVEWAVVALSALLISFLATIYPALQAARQKPVEVLRYE
jgi:lipoprotein-releasing system permease protein